MKNRMNLIDESFGVSKLLYHLHQPEALLAWVLTENGVMALIERMVIPIGDPKVLHLMFLQGMELATTTEVPPNRCT